MNTTVFSTCEFVDAWSRHFGEKLRSLALPFEERGTARRVHAIATAGRGGLLTIEFGPAGFYASPGWAATLDDRVVDGLLTQLRRLGVRCFTWNVRFDHGAIAQVLEKRGLIGTPLKTQVLFLNGDHAKTTAGYAATLRNHVRKGHSRCVISPSESADDLARYYAVHERLMDAKGTYRFVYPEKFLLDLVNMHGLSRFLVAKVNDVVVAGALFLRDGDSVYYLHGAYDREFSSYYPSIAIMDEGIRWANEIGARTINLGGSGGIESLERFKASWGTEFVNTWRFGWRNPLWSKLDRVKSWFNKS